MYASERSRNVYPRRTLWSGLWRSRLWQAIDHDHQLLYHGGMPYPRRTSLCPFPHTLHEEPKFIDELAPYVAGKPDTVNGSTIKEYCMEVYRDGVSYYPTGLVVADKATQNKPFYSLVVEAGQLLPGHTIEGYTVEMGRLCDPEGSEQVVKTYAAAANYIIEMKPNTFHDYIMCMAKESTVTFVKFEKGGGPSDFILKYSGLPTTKSIKGSFIESQLNYIGTMVEQERANTLKKSYTRIV